MQQFLHRVRLVVDKDCSSTERAERCLWEPVVGMVVVLQSQIGCLDKWLFSVAYF